MVKKADMPSPLGGWKAEGLRYRVGALREAGLDAKWSKTGSGAPIIVVRNLNAETAHQRVYWWYCDKDMFTRMQKVGIIEGFNQTTILGDILSI